MLQRMVKTLASVCIGLVLFANLAACQPQKPAAVQAPSAADLGAALKTVESAQGGWKASEAPKFFTHDTLFDLMDGQSDAFFVYGFEKAGVQRFLGTSGSTLIVSLFQVDTPESAYGLFTANRDPNPVALGNDGSGSPGQRLSYWQDRYFVQITALPEVADADLQSAGQVISKTLPKGGQTPAVMARLPKDNMTKDFPMFFHQELSIQDRVWLGGENKLGLGLDTQGALGSYSLEGQTVTLLVIVYPDAAKTAKGLEAARSGGLDELLVAKAQDKLLALAFGKASPASGEKLVDAALK